MKKLIFALMLSCAALPINAWAASDEIKACPALNDEKAYTKKSKDLMYLLQGEDGWFFRSKADLYDNYALNKNALRRYRQLVDALAKRGTTLVVAYTPTRGLVAKDFLPVGNPLTNGFDPKTSGTHYLNLINAMNDNGITMVGFTEPKAGAEFFNKTDQHWTSAGADEMADALAKVIKSLPAYKDVPKKSFVTKELPDDDLFDGSFNRAYMDICHEKLPQEKHRFTETTPVQTSEDGSSLFGEQSAPEIVLVGTSNSREKMNFDGMLAQKLSADVLNKAVSGGGLQDAMLAYLASDTYREHPPKILIWEIPGYLNLPSDDSRAFLRQAIPAVYGTCDDKSALAHETIKVDAGDKPLFTFKEPLKYNADNTYFALEFNIPSRAEFSLKLTYADQSTETVKIKRSSRYPTDGKFYVTTDGNKPVASATLTYPEAIADQTLDAKICVLPAVTKENKPSTRPVSPQPTEGGDTIWQKFKSIF